MKIIYKLIKLNRLFRSYRLKFLGVLICDLVGIRHLFLRLDPVNACNLKCGMCYFSADGYAKKIRGRFTGNDIERIAELFFPKTLQLVIGCSSEPTLYKDYPRIIQIAKQRGVPFVGFTTNAQLMDKKMITMMVVNGLDEITVSVHGVQKESYEKFMVGASYDKFLENLSLINTVKAELGKSKPTLRLNYTVNSKNMEELEDFFSVYGGYDIDTLQIRPMVDVGKTSFAHCPFNEEERKNYDRLISYLQEQSAIYGVTLLATKGNVNFEQEEKGVSYALPAVLRTIHPNKVWHIDFDWRNENYRQYCRRIKWRKTLLLSVISRKEYFKKSNLYLTYDVDY